MSTTNINNDNNTVNDQ